MTPEQVAQMQAELAALKAENLQLQTDKASFTSSNKLTFKVGTKQNVSVYGLGRFPVTLYANQWQRLLEVKGDILNFIETGIRNGTISAEKPAKVVAKPTA
jgi:hypothetical protein